MHVDNIVTAFFLFGFAGFGLGVGLVLGSFIIRGLRHMMRDVEKKDKDAE